MTFAGAIKTCFTKYADFRGTAARPEYWYFVLFTILVSIVLSTVDSIVFPADPDANLLASSMRPSPFSDVANLLMLLPTLAVLVRRMRDAGFGAKWLTLLLAPLVVAIGSFGVIAQSFADMESATVNTILPLLVALLPALLVAAAVQLFFFIVTLLKSKKPAQAQQFQDQTGTTA